MFSYEVLGQILKELRKRKGLSQNVVSGLAGIARTHLTMIENGSIHAGIDTVWKLAAALDISPAELFALVERRIESGEDK